MRIAIDGTALSINNGGVSSYLRGLLTEFHTSSNQIDLFSPPSFKFNPRGVSKKIQTLYRELVWQQILLPKISTRHKSDILFSPSHIISCQKGIKKAVTFHDMYIMRNPLAFRKWHSIFSNYIYPKIFNSDAHFIAISEFTKKEMLHYFPHHEKRIRVIKSAISSDFRVITDQSELLGIKSKFNLPAEFILTVGSLEPRKNIISLLNLYNQVNVNELPILVLVSPDGWNNKIEIDLIHRLSDRGKLIWLKNIDRNELIALYNMALLMVYPSLYEGFGMPPMEAMACKCPVITSNNSSLSEYYSESALLLNNPEDLDELKFTILKILQDQDLIKKLRDLGFKNTLNYNFKNSAAETLAYFSEITT